MTHDDKELCKLFGHRRLGFTPVLDEGFDELFIDTGPAPMAKVYHEYIPRLQMGGYHPPYNPGPYFPRKPYEQPALCLVERSNRLHDLVARMRKCMPFEFYWTVKQELRR